MKNTRTAYHRWTGLILTAALLSVGSGCAKKKQQINVFPDHNVELSESSADSDAANVNGAGPSGSMNGAVSPGSGSLDSMHAEVGRSGDNIAPVGSTMPELTSILFKFDDDSLSTEAGALLAQHAAFLKQHSELHVILRGHTDDQGTEEYNLSLGSRRAQSVRDKLIELGIGADRMETVSFGEAVPIVEDASEADKAKNRRVEFFVYTLE